ncbi:DnaJ sub C member 12 [Dimargaris verticillata]|uniref:DnaJ sub C member 12 n=1 Tax=Dimargaris verticillata TaxID=2761393 RepID=A0A9W8BCK3_9FUNG|nr:DnaJ sub C member 12 [Dimargaris verticillata]
MSFAHLLSNLADSSGAAFWSDLYTVLNCSPHSTPEQITAEYRAKLLTCHPDKFSGQAYDDSTFIQVRQAYVILSDPLERAKYDTWQQSGLALSYPRWRESSPAVFGATKHLALRMGLTEAVEQQLRVALAPVHRGLDQAERTLANGERSLEV